jgi:hypothetical protein
MKLSLTRDTLAYQLGVRPALQFRDLSTVPLKQVVHSMVEFMELGNAYHWIDPKSANSEPVTGDPHKDAVIFYMLSHATNILRKRLHPLEPLGKYEEILDIHAEQMALRGTRLFYYLLAICTREARHTSGFVNDGKKNQLVKKFGSKVIAFHEKIMDESETVALESLKESPPDVSVGQFLGYLAAQFKKDTCHYGSAFGGDPWSNIAMTAHDFANGELSLELMMDKAFALEHNTAAIFNKPLLFSHSHGDLRKILDVQRAGMIPQLVMEDGVKCASDKMVKEIHAKCAHLLGDEFTAPGYVDWYKVEEFAQDSHKYPAEKKAQQLKWGAPSERAG